MPSLQALTHCARTAVMALMMRAAGKEHLLTRVEYPDAGHLIEPPYSPHFRASNYINNAKKKVTVLWGGQTKPHSDTQEDSSNKILAFLQQHLYSSPTPTAVNDHTGT